jgi:hypothetical protein
MARRMQLPRNAIFFPLRFNALDLARRFPNGCSLMSRSGDPNVVRFWFPRDRAILNGDVTFD